MLQNLIIKNYALIDTLNVDFSSGFTAITGETGAGKSILLGALSLLLGKRADSATVKNKEKKCIIEGTFAIQNYQLESLFKAEDVDFEPQTILRREILPTGKSRAFINDTPVNLHTLQRISQQLIDIHSQHETLAITNTNYQFKIVDALANTTKLVTNYNTHLKEYKALQAKLKQLKEEQETLLKEQDYTAFLLEELEQANLTEGQTKTLEEEYHTLQNVESIQEKLSQSEALLQQEQIGILELLNQLQANLQKLANTTPTYEKLYQQVQSNTIDLKDVLQSIVMLQEQVEANPQRLEELNAKLQTVYNLQQKHRVTTEAELLQIQNNLQEKVSNTVHLSTAIATTEKNYQETEQILNTLAEKIHNKRVEVVPNLIQQLETISNDLGMPNARFSMQIEKTDTFYPNGKDAVNLTFSANKGSDFKTLKKVASGGELTRIMLAVKAILANYSQLPTLIFDEIDTGVSGEIANKMATIMQQMARKMQIFSITHLPQIAAKANAHFKVFKNDVNQITTTQITALNYDERIVEIAQMLGGVQTSASAIAHAKELLN